MKYGRLIDHSLSLPASPPARTARMCSCGYVRPHDGHGGVSAPLPSRSSRSSPLLLSSPSVAAGSACDDCSQRVTRPSCNAVAPPNSPSPGATAAGRPRRSTASAGGAPPPIAASAGEPAPAATPRSGATRANRVRVCARASAAKCSSSCAHASTPATGKCSTSRGCAAASAGSCASSTCVRREQGRGQRGTLRGGERGNARRRSRLCAALRVPRPRGEALQAVLRATLPSLHPQLRRRRRR